MSRKDMLRIIGVVLVAWVALLVVVSRIQQGRSGGRRAGEPDLPHYPGTEAVQEQTSESLGMRKYWFRLEEDYPSKTVYYFYKKRVEPQGWELVGEGEPRWYRRESGDTAHDLFRATWLSPDRLFQLDLDMVSEVTLTRHGEGIVSEEREPGIRVYVSLHRVTAPQLMFRERRKPGRGEMKLR